MCGSVRRSISAMRSKNHWPERIVSAAADQVEHPLGHFPRRLAQQRPLGGAHLGRRAGDHQDRLALAAAEQAVAGRVAGDRPKSAIGCAASTPAADRSPQPVGGEVQHRREHAVQVELVDLAMRRLLPRAARTAAIGGDGIRLPAANAKPVPRTPAKAKSAAAGVRPSSGERKPNFARHLLRVLWP